MGFLSAALERRDVNLSLTDYDQWVELGLASKSAAGVSVTPWRAMQFSAVYACVRILAETIAGLPLILYERLDRGRRRASEHYLYELLKDRPNEAMSSFEYREALQGHLALWGNAYSFIDWDGGGRVKELMPLQPEKMIQILDVGGRLFYQYQMPWGELRTFTEDSIWHLRGLSSDGRIGYSPIRMAREAIGLGMAVQEFGARFFANDASAGVVLMHPEKLSPDAQKNIRESWEEMHVGLDKKHRLAILEEGMKAEKITIPPEDAQFLQTRKFQLQEIARMFRIPPHMLADLDRATFSNIEHQGIEFVIYTLQPWLVRWEQSIWHKFLLPAERKRFYAEHLVEGLLRGDTQTRYAAYAVARQNGWMSANDIRELENLNPIEGGDTYLVPLNMVPANEVGLAGGSEEDQDNASAERESRARRSLAGRRRLGKVYRRLIEKTAGRLLRKEMAEIRKAAERLLKRRDLQDFQGWLDRFYEDHRGAIQRDMMPVLTSFAESIADEISDELGLTGVNPEELERFMQQYVQSYAGRHINSSEGQVLDVVSQALRDGQDLLAALDARFGEWEERRPDRIARWESVQAGSAAAKFAYMAAGVTLLRWISSGKSCPYCSRLDNKVVGIEEAFIREGESFEGEGGAEPLRPNVNVGHPPAHDGCDCGIIADFGRALAGPPEAGLPVSVETRRRKPIARETRALVTLMTRALGVPEPGGNGGLPVAARRE